MNPWWNRGVLFRSWGFRLIGGRDEGLVLKVDKVETNSQGCFSTSPPTQRTTFSDSWPWHSCITMWLEGWRRHCSGFHFFAFLKCRLFGIILTVFYSDILYSQVEGVLVTMMTHPEVVQLIRGIFLLIKNCQHIELNKCEVVSCIYAKVLEGSSWQWECNEATTSYPTLGGQACSSRNFVPDAWQI